MCVHPNTPEYDVCVNDLARLTRQIAAGQATAAVWLQRGECLQLMGEIPGAIRDYHRAHALREQLSLDQLAHLYVRRGVCYRRSLKFEQAVADLLQALALKPGEAYYWSCLGIARYYQGELSQAAADLTRALELDPVTDERSWEIRALCRQALGEHEKAIADLTSRLAMDVPAYALLYAYRAYSHLMLGHYDLAIADCQRGEQIDHHEDTYDLYWIRGHARLVQGDAAGALGDLSTAIALRRDVAELYLWRGLAFRALGDEISAADDLTEFASRHPRGTAQALSELAGLLAGGTPAPAPVQVPAQA